MFFKQLKLNQHTRNMERLERDLTFFKRALEQESDPERRRLLLIQIRNIERDILTLLTEERARVRRENECMRKALDDYEAANKK